MVESCAFQLWRLTTTSWKPEELDKFLGYQNQLRSFNYGSDVAGTIDGVVQRYLAMAPLKHLRLQSVMAVEYIQK